MHLLKKAILKTIAYSDIFDFPLTKKEIWQYIFAENFKYPISDIQFKIELENLNNKINFKSGYFCFKGREEIITERKKREKISLQKLLFAQKIVTILQHIPTIQLIAISGSLAMKNAEITDDIDFFIITRKNTLWITRLLTGIFLETLGVRRKRKEKNVANKICTNMFLDKGNLSFPKEKQTLYIAHEIIQMRVLFNKNNTYNQFLHANTWVKNFLPNAFSDTGKHIKQDSSLDFIFPLLEKFSELLQKKYMQKKIGNEIVTNTLLAFHPENRELFIQKELEKRYKKYEI